MQVRKKATPTLVNTLAVAWANGPFRILLFAYTISAFGALLPSTLILYYVDCVLEEEVWVAHSALSAYVASGLLFLPAWIWLSRKFDKKQTWIAAMLLNAGAFAFVFFLSAGQTKEYLLLVTLSGIGFGATMALPSSMQADVIDYDQSLHGVRREGQFIGLWSIAKKLSAALGAGIGLQILGWSGYRAGAPQSSETLLALRVLYAGLPSICYLCSVAIAWRYPIDRARYQQIREIIEQGANEELNA